MKPSFVVVLVTAPNRKVARALARSAVSARVAACVNLVPAIESHYWWEGRVTSGREILLMLKTTTRRLAALERFIVEQHPYDTPEFLALPVKRGAQKYLDWIAGSVRQTF